MREPHRNMNFIIHATHAYCLKLCERKAMVNRSFRSIQARQPNPDGRFQISFSTLTSISEQTTVDMVGAERLLNDVGLDSCCLAANLGRYFSRDVRFVQIRQWIRHHSSTGHSTVLKRYEIELSSRLETAERSISLSSRIRIRHEHKHMCRGRYYSSGTRFRRVDEISPRVPQGFQLWTIPLLIQGMAHFV